VEEASQRLLGLKATVVVEHPVTKELYVNFDHSILELNRETRLMQSIFQREVPRDAEFLLQQGSRLKEMAHELSALIGFFKKTVHDIPVELREVFQHRIDSLRASFSPMLTVLTWTSLNVTRFIEGAKERIISLQDAVRRSHDILYNRVGNYFRQIRECNLLDLPSRLVSVSEFAEAAVEPLNIGIPQVDHLVVAIERSVKEGITLILCDSDTSSSGVVHSVSRSMRQSTDPNLTSSSIFRRAAFERSESSSASSQTAIQTVIQKFEKRTYQCVAMMLERNLRELKKKFGSSSSRGFLGSSVFSMHSQAPVFQVDIQFANQRVEMVPSLDDIQECVNHTAKCVLGSVKQITRFGESRPPASLDHRRDTTSSKFASQHMNVFLRAQSEHDVNPPKQASSTLSSSRFSVDIKRMHTVPAPRKRISIASIASIGAEVVEEEKSYYNRIGKNRAIIKIVFQLTGTFAGLRKKVENYLMEFHQFDHLWKESKTDRVKDFIKSNPSLEDFEAELKRFDSICNAVADIMAVHHIDSLSLSCKAIKASLQHMAIEWKNCYGFALNKWCQDRISKLLSYIDSLSKRLSIPIVDLSDVCSILNAVHELFQNEMECSMQLLPLVEAHAMLRRYAIPISDRDISAVDTLQHKWLLLLENGASIRDKLHVEQDTHKRQLRKEVARFKAEWEIFIDDYGANGPFVDDISPKVAMERMEKYRREFAEFVRQMSFLSQACEIFGLDRPDKRQQATIEKELDLGNQLYSLYMRVVTSSSKWNDMFWSDCSFADIESDLAKFNEECTKLPGEMRSWHAFDELSATIESWSDAIPVLVRLTDRSIRPRHWREIREVTGSDFEVGDGLRVGHIIDANIMLFADHIDEMCYNAVKEAELESKFQSCKEQWIDQEFEFLEYLDTDRLILNPRHTADIMFQLEETQLLLTSITNSRYGIPLDVF